MAASAWDEVEALARRHVSGVSIRPSEQSVHIQNVDEPDDSDKRRFQIGLAGIDRGLKPLLPGGFTVIGARQGHGKTSLAEVIALANSQNYMVTFATLEMTAEDLRERVVARMLNMSLDDADWHRNAKTNSYQRAISALSDLRLHLWHPTRGAKKDVAAIVAVAEQDDADMLIIDYTRKIDGWIPGSGGPFQITSDLSGYSKQSRRHVVLLSQLNRDAQGKRPIPSQLQDTGLLEQEAEKCLLLYRPFSGMGAEDTICEIIVAKNRRGPEFRGHVGWSGSRTEFLSMSLDEERLAVQRCCG